MRFSIRPMREGDVDAVARLRCDAFFQGTPRTAEEDAADLRQLLEGTFEAALVADIDGVPVGTCLFVRHEIDAAHDLSPWLAGLVVAPDQRGDGLGSALVRAIENHAASVGCSRLHLYTDAAEPFYTALGWQVAERFVQHGEASVLMSKDF